MQEQYQDHIAVAIVASILEASCESTIISIESAPRRKNRASLLRLALALYLLSETAGILTY